MESESYTVKDVCERLNLSPSTLKRWEKARLIQRAGRDWRGWRRYTPDDLRRIQALIEEKARQNSLALDE